MTISRGPVAPDLEALESITEVALFGVDPDELLHRLIRRMVEVSGAAAGVILLLEGELLVPRAAHGLDERVVARYQPRRGEGFAGRVLLEERPLSIPNAVDEGSDLAPYLEERGIKSMLGVPLKANGRTIGVAHIDLLEERAFTAREIHRFEVLADRAAIAIAHSQLLRESQERAAALERANARLEAANAELREVDRLKTDFLSMVSHELRTPLTAIIGYTDLLLRGTHGELNERQHRHQVAVKLGAQRLLALINDLLDASRLDSGLVELDLAEVSLTSVFDEAVACVREAAAEAGLSLRVELPADLPTVRGDQGRLVQLLTHLLANAVKFTPAGGRVDLWAQPHEAGDRIQVGVQDTGAGIGTEHLAHIWDRFYQADSSVRRRYGGTGLGLAIVRNLVELHGGSITASSAGPNQGATFCFTLPIYVGDGGAKRPTADEDQEFRPTAVTRRPTATVLVVEDEPDNRELLTTMLQEMLGLQVITAGDGYQALEQVENGPDLILLDLILPLLNGFEVVSRLKADERTRHIPVLALTALTRPTERDEALAAGCDGLIVKPFDTDELIRVVAEQLKVTL